MVWQLKSNWCFFHHRTKLRFSDGKLHGNTMTTFFNAKILNSVSWMVMFLCLKTKEKYIFIVDATIYASFFYWKCTSLSLVPSGLGVFVVVVVCQFYFEIEFTLSWIFHIFTFHLASFHLSISYSSSFFLLFWSHILFGLSPTWTMQDTN